MLQQQLNGLCAAGLAHVGDAVYELYIRTRLAKSGLLTARNLHSATVKLVRASAQAAAARTLERELSEPERAVFRRGRNTEHHHTPQASTPAEYALATGLEALLGWLYLSGETDRVDAVCARCWDILHKEEARQ
ncbi:MAG: Mini-ribonuclease 3 [Eubacteriales bacterium]